MEHDLLLRELDTIQVKGRAQGSQIFEVMAEKNKSTENQKRVKKEYEAALGMYRKGDFVLAEEKFLSLYKSDNDLASKTMSERCRTYIDSPPDKWLGIVEMKEK